MRKKFVVVVTVICLALTMGLLAACNNNPPPPEGGSWTVRSDNKIWTKTLTLKFEDEENFAVYDGSDSWITGKYKFADKPGTSTLTLWNADTAIPGVAKDGEKTYEPTEDGIYTIEFDHGTGGKTTYKFQPPQDGTKPGEETPTECTEHIDADNDEKCDVCEEAMPATAILTLTAADAGSVYLPFPAKLALKSNAKFAMEIAYYDIEGVDQYITAATGTWAPIDAEDSMSDLTLTYDALYTAIAGATDTVAISLSADYTKVEYSVTIEYNTPAQGDTPAMNMVFSFTGELSIG